MTDNTLYRITDGDRVGVLRQMGDGTWRIMDAIAILEGNVDIATVNVGDVAMPDGQDVAEGATTDAPYSDPTGAAAGSLVSLAKARNVFNATNNPIYDHANGTKTSVTVSATIITPPTGCQFVEIETDVDIYVNTAGSDAVDDGTAIVVPAGAPRVLPVTAGTDVTALSSADTATVRCTPFKVR